MHFLVPRIVGRDCVVPLRADVVTLKLNTSELRVGVFDLHRVVARIELCCDLQTGSRGGSSNQGKQLAQSSQRFAGPIQRDETEQAMFDPILFRGAGWVVAHRDRQARLGGEFLQFLFPQTTAGRIAASAIGQQQQIPTTGVVRCGRLPPTPQAVDGELRGVGRLAHAHMSVIAAHVVHSIGDCAALGVLREIVSVDLFRCVAPSGSVVGEGAHEFLVLGVDAQHRTALLQSHATQPREMSELSISVRMRLAAESFDVGSQPIAGLPQQASHHIGTGTSIELFGQLPETAPHPLRRVSSGRSRRFRFDGALQVGRQLRIFFWVFTRICGCNEEGNGFLRNGRAKECLGVG